MRTGLVNRKDPACDWPRCKTSVMRPHCEIEHKPDQNSHQVQVLTWDWIARELAHGHEVHRCPRIDVITNVRHRERRYGPTPLGARVFTKRSRGGGLNLQNPAYAVSDGRQRSSPSRSNVDSLPAQDGSGATTGGAKQLLKHGPPRVRDLAIGGR
jgi:hypothetical protein